MKKGRNLDLKYKLIILICLLFFLLIINIGDFNKVKTLPKKVKIGVIGEHHSQNIGNNLLKYAMFVKLKELGFEPQM